MIYDPVHIIQKFNKIIELIETYRIISCFPVSNAKICKNAKQIFSPPSISLTDAQWEDFDATKPFDLGITKDDWFAFQGDLIIPQEILERNDLLTKITFSIKKKIILFGLGPMIHLLDQKEDAG